MSIKKYTSGVIAGIADDLSGWPMIRSAADLAKVAGTGVILGAAVAVLPIPLAVFGALRLGSHLLSPREVARQAVAEVEKEAEPKRTRSKKTKTKAVVVEATA